MKTKKISVLLIVLTLVMIPLVNAQNVHGWEWGVDIGDLNEYEMTIDYDIVQDTRHVYINITSLCNLTTTTAVADISVGHKIMYTDYSDLESIQKSAFETYFDTPVALPIGNWEVISENAPSLMGTYFSYVALLVNDTVVEDASTFGFNLDYADASVAMVMNMSWYKSDGTLGLYNMSFSSAGLDVGISLVRVNPPEPSPLDGVLSFIEDNLILVVGVVAVLCIIAGIANKK